MSRMFLELEEMSAELQDVIKQDLKFKTGNFVWRVKFNVPLDPTTVNNSTMYVSNASQVPLKTLIRYNISDNEVEVEPQEPYAQNESYILNITSQVKSRSGKPLKKNLQVKFKL